MAKLTLVLATAQLAAKDAEIAALQSELSHLQSRVRHDYVERAEYNRVQAVLRSTQQFMAKYKRQASPAASSTKRPFSERAASQNSFRLASRSASIPSVSSLKYWIS